MKAKNNPLLIVSIIVLTTMVALLYLKGEQWLRDLLLYLSGAPWARRLVTGLPLARQAASRFVAGETVAEALSATKMLNDEGFLVSLDFLGESVSSEAEAVAARDEILYLLEQIDATGAHANVSVKPTQLGLSMREGLAFENIHALLAKASEYNNWIRLDMEDSPYIDRTLALYRTLRFEEGFNNVGVVIQSYLFRSAADTAWLTEVGARVRLVKGAYAEPPELAYTAKTDTDANFIALMEQMLSPTAVANGVRLAIASHDEQMIQATINVLKDKELPPTAVEFQMLYGIRRELQRTLRDQGYPVRIYVPYGHAWYPYFTRRLAERPANLWFFLSNVFSN